MKASTPFVGGLRTRGEALKLGSDTENPLRLRAQVLEAWDAIRIDADPLASVRSLKELALREVGTSLLATSPMRGMPTSTS